MPKSKASYMDGSGFSLVAFCHCHCFMSCTVVTIFNSVSFEIRSVVCTLKVMRTS